MVTSQNGFSANDRSQVTSYVVTASGRRMTLRKGSTGEMLAHCVRWFDENIRDLDPGELDEWGYAERPIRGGVELSNHASGTAADVDATKWPLGVEPTSYLTKPEVARLKEHLTVYQGCIRWGGDYTGRKDPMHFEIDRDQATVDRVWAQISQGDDMPLSQADLNAISVVVKQWVINVLRDEKIIQWPAENGGPQSVAQQLVLDAKGLAEIGRRVAELEGQPSAPSSGAKLPTEFDVPGFIQAIKVAVADELDRRARDNDAKTGPVS